MLSYLLRRLLIAIPLLVAASFIVFLVVTNLPGDPCAELEKYKTKDDDDSGGCASLYVDGPFMVRYGRYLGRAAQMDFGRDIKNQIRKVFGEKVFKTTISKSVRLEESPAYKKSIFAFSPASSGAAEYYSLSEEVIGRV